MSPTDSMQSITGTEGPLVPTPDSFRLESYGAEDLARKYGPGPDAGTPMPDGSPDADDLLGFIEGEVRPNSMPAVGLGSGVFASESEEPESRSPVNHLPSPQGPKSRARGVDGKLLRRGQRSQDRHHLLNRQRADLLKPEVKSVSVGTRIGAGVKAKWDAMAEASGITGSAQLNLAIEDYLRKRTDAEMHVGVVQELRDIQAVLTDAAVQTRIRMERLESMVERLATVALSQENKFVTLADLERVLGVDEESGEESEADEAQPEPELP